MSETKGNSTQAVSAPEKTWEGSPLTHARRLTLRFLQALFESAPVGKCHWSVDTDKTEIIIASSLPDDTNVMIIKPAVIVEVGPAAFMNVSIDRLEAIDFDSNRVTYNDLIQASIAIHCLSPSSEESEWLSWIVGKHMWLLKNMMIQEGFFDFGRQVQFTPTQTAAVPSGDVWPLIYYKSITAPFVFQERYKVELPTRVVDKFDVEIHAVSTIEDDSVEIRKLSLYSEDAKE